MVYFQISRLGFNCGFDKNECKKYPDFCMECVKTRIKEIGFEINENLKILEMDSEERRVQMFRDLIWQKFSDVLNIKHIMLMTKNSGLPIINYAISGSDVDVELLTGFVQANITFSESGDVSTNDPSFTINHQFYEFQYKTFNILLKNGEFVRICLILDDKASDSLRTLVSESLYDYERRYRNRLIRLVNTGALEFDDTIEFIIDAFNVKLVFPMILTHTFLPDILESINKNYIQNAIISIAKALLTSKQFFFIYNLLNEVKKIVKIDANIVLYEVYLLLEKNIIIPTTIETAEHTIKNFQETRAIRVANNELISSIIANDNAIIELKEKAKSMTVEEAEKLLNQFVKRGETAEKSLAYKEALNEYEKALYLATGFDLKNHTGKISFMVLEIDKKIKEMDLEMEIDYGEKAEKNKDYINAMGHYQSALNVLKSVPLSNDIELKINKLEKKFAKLQKQI